MTRTRLITGPGIIFLGIWSAMFYLQTGPFISFNVQPGAGCTVLIQWETVPESDTLKFEVERSNDKKQWKKIAEADVRSSHKYLAIDTEPDDSMNYYRVRQVGSRGHISYSEIKWLKANTAIDIFIWPNPGKEVLYVKTGFLSGGMDIVDSGGKLIRKIIITDFITMIHIGSLAKGIYFLHISNGNQLLVEKFIKE